MNKVYATLDPHRLGAKLSLEQGNLVVTTTEVCNFERMVLGSIALGIGNAAFEGYVWSVSRPTALTNLFSIGIARIDSALDKYVGEETDTDTGATPMSCGLRTDDGADGAGIWVGGVKVVSLQDIEERSCVGVAAFNNGLSVTVVFMVNGNFVGQADLAPGFYAPAVSIGSSASPDDVSSYLNFGQRGLNFPSFTQDLGSAGFEATTLAGWYEITSEGVGDSYFCIIDEGMVSSPTDTPANTQYIADILNPEQFSIKRSPKSRTSGDSSLQQAAFGQLEILNYGGRHNYLLDNDVRGSIVAIKVLTASALLAGTAVANAPTVCTAIIDSVASPSEELIVVTLKDTIARLDRTLPVKYNPPFVADGAANVMVPLTFGAVRNMRPLLVDQPNRIYQLHDSQVANVTLVSDRAAPLDPYASPPQYTPALSGSGIQLETEAVNFPQGAVAVDCSSYGSQAIIPGAADVLAGAGDFSAAWTGSPAHPPGWTFSNNAGGSLGKTFVGGATNVYAAELHSATAWDGSTHFGDWIKYPGILLAGSSYRLNMGVANVYQAKPEPGAMKGGIMIASALSNLAADYISGYRAPITDPPGAPPQNLSFEFTVPAGSTRDLYIMAIPTEDGVGSGLARGTVQADVFNVTLELLGQYQSLPLAGIPMENYFTEILVNRAGESSSIFNSAEAAALTLRDDGTLIPWGIHFKSPPNILEALREPLDTFNATLFTDHLGVLRVRRLVDPTDPDNTGTVLCDFDTTNVERPLQIESDLARGLTTLFGVRRNVDPFGASEFVTDQAIVSQDVKTRFSRTSQYQVTSSASPAGQYSFAIGAGIFDSLFDEATDAQDQVDKEVGIYGPKIYSDGSFTTGKRQLLTFTAHFDDVSSVGSTVKCALTDIMFGDIVRLTYPNADGTDRYVDQLGAVMAWEIWPFAHKLTLTIMV